MTTALGLIAIAVGLVVAAQLPSMRKNGRRSAKRMRRNGVRKAHGGWVAYQTDAQGREVAGFGPFPTKARAQAALAERTKLASMSRAERIAYAWGPRGGSTKPSPRAKAKASPAKRPKATALPRARPKKKASPRGGLTAIERLLMRKNGALSPAEAGRAWGSKQADDFAHDLAAHGNDRESQANVRNAGWFKAGRVGLTSLADKRAFAKGYFAGVYEELGY